MARYPEAMWRRLPGDEPKITPKTVIFHTMVGTLPGTDTWFRSGRSGGVEAHFGVGGPWEGASYDGVVWQWRDTQEQADANFRANTFAISIETSDGGDATRPWTPRQLQALIDLGRWLADTHLIPRRICPAWDQGGFGWHAMWGAPSNWTPAAGKTCPGATRIAQLKQTVLPAIFAKEEPMADTDTLILAELRKLREDLTVFGTTGLEPTVEDFASRQRDTLAALKRLEIQAAAIASRVTAIEDGVERLLGNPTP